MERNGISDLIQCDTQLPENTHSTATAEPVANVAALSKIVKMLE